MPNRVFELFTRMIADLPPQAILNAIDLECNMLENDAKNHRLPLPEDALSILCFREFVYAVQLGQTMRPVKPLPPDHIEILKKMVVRLVQANELPQTAMEQFDCIFAPDMYS